MWEKYVDCDVCHRMMQLRKLHSAILDLHFEDSNLKIVDHSETVRASARIHGTTFKDFDICQRTISLRKLHLMTYFFKVKNSKFYHLGNGERQRNV